MVSQTSVAGAVQPRIRAWPPPATDNRYGRIGRGRMPSSLAEVRSARRARSLEVRERPRFPPPLAFRGRLRRHLKERAVRSLRSKNKERAMPYSCSHDMERASAEPNAVTNVGSWGGPTSYTGMAPRQLPTIVTVELAGDACPARLLRCGAPGGRAASKYASEPRFPRPRAFRGRLWRHLKERAERHLRRLLNVRAGGTQPDRLKDRAVPNRRSHDKE